MILERGCAERGCACYDVRVDEGVEVKTVRELTDEEIEEVAKPYCDLQNWVVDKHEFARAILRKASEK